MGWLRRVLARAWRFAFGEGVASALRWLTVYLVALGLAVTYGLGQLHGALERICEEGNQARTDAVQIGADSLIEVAAEADDETVEAYRRALERRLASANVEC